MRQRQDFYTLCPGCESKVDLTLAAKLQAARAGCCCVCKSCEHEWVCIQEWIYRSEAIDRSQPVVASPENHPSAIPTDPSRGFLQPPTTVAATQPPRPHLPTFQPPQPVAPAVDQRQVPQVNEASGLVDRANTNPVPAPHAWSWERKPEQQSATSQDSQSGFDR